MLVIGVASASRIHNTSIGLPIRDRGYGFRSAFGRPGMTRVSMPAIKPDRVLGDLYKLRTFGTYKTGVHRPTFSPDDIAARQLVRRAMHRRGARDHDRRHRQHLRKEQGERRARRCPARIWKARTMRAGSTARSAASTRWRPRARSRRRAAMPASTSWCSATRKGISARSSAASRSPACSRTRTSTRRRTATTARRCARR